MAVKSIKLGETNEYSLMAFVHKRKYQSKKTCKKKKKLSQGAKTRLCSEKPNLKPRLQGEKGKSSLRKCSFKMRTHNSEKDFVLNAILFLSQEVD